MVLAREVEREIEQGFSKEVKLAKLRERGEHMLWATRRPTRQIIRATRVARVRKVEEKFRPSRPNYLYLLAQEARGGGITEYERLLHTLGHGVSGDTLLGLEYRLQVTFDPQSNHTRKWWLEPSYEAAQWLKEKVAEPPRSKSVTFTQIDPELAEIVQLGRDKSKYLDPDLVDIFRVDSYISTLSRRQAQIAWLYGQFHDESRPHETVGAIAQVLGISPKTVRWHLDSLKENANFRRVLGG
jgi:DNA-binding CsgD family transcriptional regulator